MNNNEISPMDRLMNTIASGFTTGAGDWKPGVHIDGQKVASLPSRDGSCESDFIATEPDLWNQGSADAEADFEAGRVFG